MAKTYYPFHAVEKVEESLVSGERTAVLTLHNDETVSMSDDPTENATATVLATKAGITISTDDSKAPPIITGVNSVTIWENDAFDPMAGVSATDWEGNTVPVTVTGSVDVTVPGVYQLTYTAEDSEGRRTTRRRTVTVKELEAPHFTGITSIRVKQGTDVDLEAGVKAWLGSTEITYTYTPTDIPNICAIGTTTVTYSATGNGKTTTVDREVTITESANPTITGNTPLTVFVNTETDVLDGLVGHADGGDPLPVVLDDELKTLTMTVSGVDTTVDYLKDNVVNLQEPTVASGYSFKGWYNNSSYTGSPITTVTMNTNKHIYAKVVRQYALTRTVLGVDTEEIFDDGTVVTLTDPVITEDRKRFDAWYDNSSYTGTAVTTVTMNADQHVYAKVVDQVGYAKMEGTTLKFFVDDTGKYDSDNTVFKNFENVGNTPVVPWSGETITAVVIQDVIKPKNTSDWFNGYKYASLGKIESYTGLNKLDMSACTQIRAMFRRQIPDTARINLDLSSWDVSSVTNPQDLFLGSYFQALNLTGWDIGNFSAGRSIRMFKEMPYLTTIYADFNLTYVTDTEMFTDDNNLVGGGGTAYAMAGVADSSYARLDLGLDRPGYFSSL